ncbi:hypothetical protein CBR_g38334 [Chara braunii]|uniref:Retrotransposon gag domain-containing protein n=1 Tax=Chara braunii TaxID=69332 RepID=A0A388LQ81_CHABU|nr:hypothetical protein CBR_g38334 [Chara braunii]|eukprot:GBG84362.1 hypothetical protein CBR_g38334 [Chara braunii]
MMLNVMRGVMWNNKLLQAHLHAERQQRQQYQQDLAAITADVRDAAMQQQQQQQLMNSTIAHINGIEAKGSAGPGCTTDAPKQINERIDHVVTIIGDIGVFNGPDTISSTVAALKTDITKLQTRPDAAAKTFKMPHFDICKFDDYNKSDALTWWQRFLTEASCRTVPANDMLKALYLQLIGGAKAWMNHLPATHKCTIAELHTHITWKEFEQLWFTRFMVRNVVKAAMNEVYTCSQGNMPTREWTTKWQKIVTTRGFDLTFPNQRSEFFSRSCAGLRSTLGNEYDYTTFQAILNRANLVIQTDDKAANERQSQPHYVAKQAYQRPSFVINIPPHLTVHRVFHASKLAIYTPPSADEFPGHRSQDPPSMDGHQEVDRVITHRKYGNKPRQYKVTFKQCAPDDTRGGRVVIRWVTDGDKTRGNIGGEDGGDEVKGGEVTEAETGAPIVGETRRGDFAGGNASMATDAMEERTKTKGDKATEVVTDAMEEHTETKGDTTAVVAPDAMEEHIDTKGDTAAAGRVAPAESIIEATKADEEEAANRKGAARVTNDMEGVTKTDEDAGAVDASNEEEAVIGVTGADNEEGKVTSVVRGQCVDTRESG